MMVGDKISAQEIDPDLMTVATLALTAIATLATTISTVISLRDAARREMSKPSANQHLENIEDASRDLRHALSRISDIFEEQQQRKLGNDFGLRPKFGSFAPEFNAEEFQSYQHQIQRLEQAAMSLRMWSRAMQAQVSRQQFPNERILTDALSTLMDDCNKALFEAIDFREQIGLIKSSLERIERATQGARRNQNT